MRKVRTMNEHIACPGILNSIKEIGISVIRQSDLEVLYRNDKLTELKERLWSNEDITALSGFKGRQMLEEIREKESLSTVYHDPHSGVDLDLTLSKSRWDGDTEVYIMTVAERRAGEIEESTIREKQLMGALMQVYPMIMYVNLTRDTYTIVEYKTYLTQRRLSGKYSALHLAGLASTHPDYRELFAEKFSRENLLSRYAAGEEKAYLEAKQMGPDKVYRWSSTHAIRVSNPYNDDVMQFILVRPIDEQKTLEEDYQRVRLDANRYRSAITTTFDHIFEVNLAEDSVYKIMISNDMVGRERLPGTIMELNQSVILDRIHPAYRGTYSEEMPWMKVRPDGTGQNLKIYEDDLYLLQSNGQYRWERIQFMPTEDNPNEILIYVKDINDVKQREQRQQELLYEALSSAQQANSAKRDFLSHMSHDMRTPMNAIVGLTTIARAKIDDRKRVLDALNKIETSSQHLLRLINEVLDMTQIESGKIVLEEEDFSVSELLENVMVSIRTQSRTKQQTIMVQTQELAHPRFLGDRFRMEQILLNLLSNAVKYTPNEGFIMISLSDTDHTREGITQLTLRVEDNGVGMSEEFLTRLFDPFEREITDATQDEEGTGLGLPIVKSIVERMNGTIYVESELGKGSCFTVTIPIKTLVTAEEEKAEQPDAGFGGEILPDRFKGKRFLLVDDNELNREIGQEILQMYGARVDLACNGQQAVDILVMGPENVYDAVFMDIQMPVKNGYEATRDIRSAYRDDLLQLPIFAMTANAFANDVQDALNAGMNAHISKPLDMAVLSKVLDQFLK